MAEKKVTKREMFEQIKAHLTDEAEIAFVEHELELLAKKNSADKKPTANQLANEGIKDRILAVMSANEGLMTITDIQKSIEDELSNQRVSALVRQLVADGKVERVEDKRKAFFKVV